RQQAPLVSIEANLIIGLYSLGEKERARFDVSEGQDIDARLEAAHRSLEMLESRFEERVGCWSAIRALGRNFPKSTETVLTELSFERGQFKCLGISRSATVPD